MVLNPPECDTDSNGDSDDSDNPSEDTTILSKKMLHSVGELTTGNSRITVTERSDIICVLGQKDDESYLKEG